MGRPRTGCAARGRGRKGRRRLRALVPAWRVGRGYIPFGDPVSQMSGRRIPDSHTAAKPGQMPLIGPQVSAADICPASGAEPSEPPAEPRRGGTGHFSGGADDVGAIQPPPCPPRGCTHAVRKPHCARPAPSPQTANTFERAATFGTRLNTAQSRGCHLIKRAAADEPAGGFLDSFPFSLEMRAARAKLSLATPVPPARGESRRPAKPPATRSGADRSERHAEQSLA